MTTFIRKGTIPHALLFTGIEGVGKRTVARIFAMACNCMDKGSGKKHSQNIPDTSFEVGPCFQCASCRKISSGNHPDIIVIKPSGSYIRIDQIRSLRHTLSMKPYEAKQRVVIISEAHAMNPEAANALLKVLEEPPERTLLILTASASELLPTIVSRCQQIRFNPISREGMERFLIEKHGLEPNTAMVLATIADGSLSKAVSMNKQNWVDRRRWLINELAALSSRPIGSLLAFAEKLSKHKADIQDIFDIAGSWVRDILIYGYCPEKIINRDFADTIGYASRNERVDSLLSKLEAIRFAQKHIQMNANLRLTLEVLTFRLAGVER